MDVRIRAISKKHNFKILVIELTETMKKICEMQNTNPLASIVLSKVTAANTLLGLDLKNNEVMSSHVATSDGYVGKVIAEFQGNKVRSYLQYPQFEVQDLMVKNENPYTLALGKKGTLTVTRQLYGYEPYVSQISLVDGGIDSDFMAYTNNSSQIKTLLGTRAELDANFQIKKVVGFAIQVFPGYTDEDIEYLDQKIGNSQVICEKLSQTEAKNFLNVINELANDAVIIEPIAPLVFQCSCNRQKTLQAIKLLGQAEIRKMLIENHPVEVICEFCQKKYTISVKELKDLLN